MTERPDDYRLTRKVRDIAAPVLIWAAHFTLTYGALSAACAPRGLISPAAATLIVVLTAIPAVLLCLRSSWRNGPESELGRAARWSGLIAAVAVLFDAAPVLMMPGCY